MKFQPHYSGEASEEFWEAINASDDESLYELGCELQSLEYRLLKKLTGESGK